MIFKVPKEHIYKAGIYLIRTGEKVYIGQTQYFWHRAYQHQTNKADRPANLELTDDSTFELLEVVKDGTRRNERERYWIRFYAAQGCIMMNINGVRKPKRLKNRTRNILLQGVPEEIQQRLNLVAYDKGISLQDLILSFITEGLKNTQEA